MDDLQQKWITKLAKKFTHCAPCCESDLVDRARIELQDSVLEMIKKDYGKVGDISLAYNIINMVEKYAFKVTQANKKIEP